MENHRSLEFGFWPGPVCSPIDSAPSAICALLILLWSEQMTKWGETQK